MRSMPELTLIQETVERASANLQSMLTLVRLSFDEAAVEARNIAEFDDPIVDPLASALFEEARGMLLQPAPNLLYGLAALDIAASREPECYGQTHRAIRTLLLQGICDTATAELAAAGAEQEQEQEQESPLDPEHRAQKRS